MSFFQLNQQQGNPDYKLFFDGATAGGNPGGGGCGAVCYRGEEEIFRVSSALGVVTNNAAEYSGLILGLRRLLRDYPIPKFSLTICGDSELVLNQVEGSYAVRSDSLRPYHVIARSLVEDIKGDVNLCHVPREANSVADKIAKDATKMKSHPGDFLVHYPSLSHLLDVSVQGKGLIAGQDAGAAARTPEILFDATTVLETFGEEPLKTLLDPGLTSYVSGKSNFTVLGILREPVVLTIATEQGTREVTITGAVAVDYLPYDVQLSVHHPDLRNSLGDDIWNALQPEPHGPRIRHDFSPSVLPERFKRHPYWSTRSHFLAAGYGL
mmetsp:Transcript_35126/g.76894  ORF Transcript_35126/g.76894 Transcript_35126/m.76894 type:complete len:324 (-) Transcript_35126:2334-3305(-)|eukprot:CAMPEP_0178557974 /NCGR_PEP_ID=MMETSP0697-20121206/10170_1 /TAXON_ID=265572 /ORGANISM="Extubocellulus spinifer, Strain CCMP396" /LENGTH=323 /DNA_ID=CAMNT_0020191061 /DNA_START=83 /DNA_END=1057 /DNA_ORIENTATION=-